MQANSDSTFRVSMLETMMLIRAYEERLASSASPTSPGTCTSVRQEAAAVGVVRALDARDRILINHRSAGHLIARGADIGRMAAEVMGRATGYCQGKSGSLHISAAELGVVLTSTIVGGELSLATGRGAGADDGPGRPRRHHRMLLRRRRCVRGHLSRVADPGGHLEAADSVCLREQPVASVRASPRNHADRAHPHVGRRARHRVGHGS